MDTLEYLQQLLTIPSPSGQEDEISLFLGKQLEEFGFAVKKDAFGNLIARNCSPDVGAILLSVHMDTVSSAVNVLPVIKDGYLVNDGNGPLGIDDKLGVAAILSLLERKTDSFPFVICITRGEEQGLSGARHLDYSLLGKVRFGYVFDANGKIGTVVIQAPGKIQSKAIFHGQSAHAGFEPEKGISAIQLACKAVNEMKLLRVDDETTANIGSFQASGATNIVCDRAELTFEVRSRNLEKLRQVQQKLEDVCLSAAQSGGGTVSIERETSYLPYEKPSNCASLVYLSGRYTGSVWPTATGGGSDANCFNAHGYDALVCAIGYEYPHTSKERVLLRQIAELDKLFTDLFMDQRIEE
ncbi:MAG: M20/M25/M40 family metallo-hydrolase [Spirochaetia bacterium]|jgi:tripeptide aminopeptidase|nr:M20/M25/M40 family metallo-hydrolase [Spirochaetia bacterium]